MKAPIATILTASLFVNLALIAVIKSEEDEIAKLKKAAVKRDTLLGLMNRTMFYVMKHELPKDFNPSLVTDLEAYLLLRDNGMS